MSVTITVSTSKIVTDLYYFFLFPWGQYLLQVSLKVVNLFPRS